MDNVTLTLLGSAGYSDKINFIGENSTLKAKLKDGNFSFLRTMRPEIDSYGKVEIINDQKNPVTITSDKSDVTLGNVKAKL